MICINWKNVNASLYVYCIDSLQLINRDSSVELIVDRTDIAWESDRDTRFQNANGNTTFPPASTTQPKNWQIDISELPNSLENEDFIVWFRVSAFPNFIKLYSRLYVRGSDTLPAGNYTLQVEYSIHFKCMCVSVYICHIVL